jgi:hypothetical protein
LEIEKSFLEDHLALWAPIFCEKMFQQAHEDVYRGISLMTKGLVEYDRIYLGNITGADGVTRGANSEMDQQAVRDGKG